VLDAARTDRLMAATVAAAALASLALFPGWRLAEAPEGLAVPWPEVERGVSAQPLSPAPGAEVWLVARRFRFEPELRLQAGKAYTLNLTSADVAHSVLLNGREVLLVPGRVQSVRLVADKTLSLQCGEYCGLDHNRMNGAITIVPGEASP
jgi:heme/copper-type cytochrome/quinol oxidase subunit 2